MRLNLWLLSLLAASVSAQTTFLTSTTRTAGSGTPTSDSTSASTTSESITDLVSALPKCALGCLQSSAKAISCDAADLKCLCSKSQQLITSLGGCILTSSCSSDDIAKASQAAPKICSAVNADPAPADVASASAAVSSALGGVSSSSSNLAPARTDVPSAMMGVAGLAGALAVFAL